MSWETDTQYTAARIREVEPIDNGWALYFDNGGFVSCPSDTCQQAPAVGEMARLYGKGFGYAVRGVVVERRVYRYLTEAEQHQQELKAEKEAAVKAAAELDVGRADRDARRAALPSMFRRRLDEFEKSIPDWRLNSEKSVLAMFEDAARIVRHCLDAEGCRRFLTLSPEEQRAVVPGLRAGQTGNTWATVCTLVTDYLRMI